MHATTRKTLLFATLVALTISYGLALDLRGIWGDEALRLRPINGGPFLDAEGHVHIGTYAGVLDRVLNDSLFQPAYHVLQHTVVRLAGSRDIVLLRGVNLCLMLGACLLLWQLTARFRHVWARWATVVWFGAHGYMMMHVLQVREYPLLMLVILATGALFFRMLAQTNATRWPACIPWVLAWAGMCAFAFYTHLWALYFCVLTTPLALLRREHRNAFLCVLAAAWVLGAILMAPWMGLDQFLGGKVQVHSWDPRPATLGLWWEGMRTGWGHLLFGNGSVLPVAVLAMVLGVGICSLTTTAWWRRRALGYDPIPLWCLWCMAGYFGFQTLYFIVVEPMSLWPRYFVCYHPFLALLLGWCIDKLYATSTDGLRRALAQIAVLLIAFQGIWHVVRHYQDPNLDAGFDMREKTAHLEAVTRPHEPIFVSHEVSYLGLTYGWSQHNPWRHTLNEDPLTAATPPTAAAQAHAQAIGQTTASADYPGEHITLVQYHGGEAASFLQTRARRFAALGYRTCQTTDLGDDMTALRLARPGVQCDSNS